ncbi:hypothetical protein [Deinococcus altitudinis]|uniref:hypothetical protein n=1 Tax=Deinococcus altitudinis TaxID=468914 RepID=UPI0038916F6B
MALAVGVPHPAGAFRLSRVLYPLNLQLGGLNPFSGRAWWTGQWSDRSLSRCLPLQGRLDQADGHTGPKVLHLTEHRLPLNTLARYRLSLQTKRLEHRGDLLALKDHRAQGLRRQDLSDLLNGLLLGGKKWRADGDRWQEHGLGCRRDFECFIPCLRPLFFEHPAHLRIRSPL